MKFLAILFVFTLAHGVCFTAIMSPQLRSWKMLTDVIFHPYYNIYGELFFEDGSRMLFCFFTLNIIPNKLILRLISLHTPTAKFESISLPWIEYLVSSGSNLKIVKLVSDIWKWQKKKRFEKQVLGGQATGPDERFRTACQTGYWT